MPTTTAELGAHRRLLEDCLAAFVANGRPTMPPDRSEEIVALLTRLMTDADLFEDYTAELVARRERFDRPTELALLNTPGTELPGEQILAEGFAGLPDDVLADLVISPEALRALDEVHFRGESGPGRWFFEAIDRRVSASPDAAEKAAATKALTAQIAAAQRAEPSPAPAPAGTRKPSRTRSWVGAGVLAASVLIGVGLGWSLRAPDERLYASVGETGWREGRGGQVPVIEVRNTGRRTLFVSVIGLAPKNDPRVFDQDNNRYVSVAPSEVRTVENFDAQLMGATTFLVVVTETPAGEVMRGAIPQGSRPEQADELKTKLTNDLRGLGYRAFQIQILTPP